MLHKNVDYNAIIIEEIMKSKSIIYQYWFNRYNNIGDLLGPWITTQLYKDMHVKYTSYVTRIEALRIVVGALIHFRLPEREYVNRIFIFKPILFVVGSILDHCKKGIWVWGAGFQNEGETCEQGSFFAVRGYETVKRLKELGLCVPTNIAVGDPAILLPILYKPICKKKHRIGIVMHDSDRAYIIEHFSQYHIIDVVTTDVEAFMDDLCSCEYILTTSMHGLILSHTYGVPALWMQKNWIGSDGFKFRDYFSSVEMKLQDPLQADDVAKISEQEIVNLFSRYESLPQAEVLDKIRRNLLDAAPFNTKKFI